MPRPLPYPVVLASASPRRQMLLQELVPSFTVDPADVNEDALTLPDAWQTAQRLAREKALVVAERHPEALVIAGDTVVAVEEGDHTVQLAKPTDPSDACRMLATLSGRAHLVITGVALRWPKGLDVFTEAATVTFRRLTTEEITAYVATGEPMDKAGAYGLQGGAKEFVESIRGEWSTVVGLPTARLAEALRDVR